MKSLKRLWTIALIACFSLHLSAQEIPPDNRNVWTGGQRGYVVIGDLTVIQNEKKINVVLSPYIQRMGASEVPDSVYVPIRVKEWNEDKAGRGDQWLISWNEARKNFQPALVEGLNMHLSGMGIIFDPEDKSGKYTFLISTRHLMEFWGSVYLILDLDLVSTDNPDAVIATVRLPLTNSEKSKGSPFKGDYERAYFSAGLRFGKYLKKEIY